MPVEYALEEWLTEAYDYQPPHRGQICQGEILKIEEQGVTIDLGLKRDGFVPYRDLERLGEEVSSQLEPGQEVVARVVRPEDREGNLILSLYQARSEKDWMRAQSLLEGGDVWQGKVTEYNRGGLIVAFGHVRGFVPASHLAARDRRGLSSNQREEKLKAYVGRELSLKVIEVNRNRRRLILSERLARQQLREQNIERLLNELIEGQVCRGRVSRLCDFGAFVDLGGAEGLIHISELA
jgi:small subunit ribosomal protein S1